MEPETGLEPSQNAVKDEHVEHTLAVPAAPSSPSTMQVDDPSSMKTPTKTTFTGESAETPMETSAEPAPPADSQLNLPSTPKGPADSIARSGSIRSNRSVESADTNGDDDGELSGNESATSETDRPSKKKRGQRFFCTEFPPCQLSFTRSEHLARHIRKHTGERPFQCHCLRRFSRLDNLRQHAQTVHVNEEIPGDSLAATGTRFQRQIRTDRMRTAGSRVRASTMSGTGTHSRGHSRNFSGSSIGSISDFGSPEDPRRRQAPLPLVQTPTRSGLTIDAYAANAGGHDPNYYYYSQSPTAFSTTTSTFSGDTTSPSLSRTMQSPIPMTPRALTWGEPTPAPARRLSVPTGTAPFQQPSPYHPAPAASPSAPQYSNASSSVQSPSTSQFSDDRRDPAAAAAATEAEIRRRTWHPGTYPYGPRPATSGLSYYQTPDAPQPISTTQPAAAQSVRLPGIDSFDRAHQQPNAPLRRVLSPMEVDSHSRRSSISNSTNNNSDQRFVDQRDSPHHQYRYPQNDQQQHTYHPPPPPGSVPSGQTLSTPTNPGPTALQLADPPTTPRHRKRQGWYNGPLTGAPQDGQNFQAPRTSPGGSSSSEGLQTPSTASITEYQPTIIHSNGVVEAAPSDVHMEDPSHKPQQTHPRSERMQHFSGNENNANLLRSGGDMTGLNALVAAAAHQSQAVENR